MQAREWVRIISNRKPLPLAPSGAELKNVSTQEASMLSNHIA
jgi:hypothetical protein